MFQNGGISLATERAQDDAERSRVFGALDHALTHRTHLFMGVLFASQNALVRVVPIRGHRRIRNHDRLEMESSIRDEHDRVFVLGVLDHRRGASEDFTRRQRFRLGHGERRVLFRQPSPRFLNRARKLNRPR